MDGLANEAIRFAAMRGGMSLMSVRHSCLGLQAKQPVATNDYAPREPFLGTNSATLALPDYHANYFAYSFVRTGGLANVGLKISGQFGHARYRSYNIYEAEAGTSFGSIRDEQMLPLPGNVNPFLPQSDAQALATMHLRESR